MVLGNVERYIHTAFATLKNEDVVQRMFTMMAFTKFQLEESKKPNPRYVLEPRIIQGMIQKADSIDKSLRTVLSLRFAVPPQPPQPPSMGPTPSFARPAPAAAPRVTVDEPRPPPTTPFQPGRGGMSGVASSSIFTQSAGAVPIRWPTAMEVTSAKRWVEEERRTAFNRSFEAVAGYPPIPDSEIQEYIRNLERLDKVLNKIERYIHIAFAALKNEDVVRRMFTIMAFTKFQLEESKKPNPRYVLKLRTIREMVQKADNMDKSLRTGLGVMLAPAPPAAPPVTVGGSRPPPTPPFQQGYRKKQYQVRAGVAVSTPPLVPIVSIPPPQAATPGITDPPPQTLKSPKWKAAAKPRASVHCKVSINANNLETTSSAHAVALTPMSSTPMDTKGGVKRIREDETDIATLGVASASSSKRVKSDWEGPPNEEAQKSEERAENVRTGEQALALFDTVTDSIDETPESGQNYVNNVLARLRDVQVLDQVSAQPPNEHNHTNLGCGV
ncbi:hypothetical protein BJY52DRAFT_1419286 [Lactarius psammicola]|nr:hypothetical protein BJY52DRAFT_1419286 [Lactarius psammicola]